MAIRSMVLARCRPRVPKQVPQSPTTALLVLHPRLPVPPAAMERLPTTKVKQVMVKVKVKVATDKTLPLTVNLPVVMVKRHLAMLLLDTPTKDTAAKVACLVVSVVMDRIRLPQGVGPSKLVRAILALAPPLVPPTEVLAMDTNCRHSHEATRTCLVWACVTELYHSS